MEVGNGFRKLSSMLLIKTGISINTVCNLIRVSMQFSIVVLVAEQQQKIYKIERLL